jgi:hypothetical protein
MFSDDEILAAAREQGADLATVQESLQQPKSPWNPSKKAIARVKDPIPVPCRPQHRIAFALSCLKLLVQGGVDGLLA